MRTVFNAIRSIRYRRGPSRLVGGIAGGIAASTGLNVWLVRLLVLLSFLLPVMGIAVYVVAWALTPWQDDSIPLEQLFGGRQDPRIDR